MCTSNGEAPPPSFLVYITPTANFIFVVLKLIFKRLKQMFIPWFNMVVSLAEVH